MNFLIDHNIEGQAKRLWETIIAEGWLDLVTIRFFTFEEVELLIESSDPAGISPSASACGLAFCSR